MLSSLPAIFKRLRVVRFSSPAALLEVFWWVLLALLALLLAADSFLFSRYGLGAARGAPPPGSAAEVVGVRDGLIKKAAAAIEARAATFRAAESVPAGLKNPFR